MSDESIAKVKMSKSKKDSAIWVHDSEEDIKRKIRNAFCPEKEVNYNPLLNWTRHILFWNRTSVFRIDREQKHGGPREFSSFEELEKEYKESGIHPLDLKNAVAKELIELLAPVREHFAKPEIAAKKAELDKVMEKK
jgi:tyrosyl-tRNA synthetase